MIAQEEEEEAEAEDTGVRDLDDDGALPITRKRQWTNERHDALMIALEVHVLVIQTRAKEK
jgi:hypothetical protein